MIAWKQAIFGCLLGLSLFLPRELTLVIEGQEGGHDKERLVLPSGGEALWHTAAGALGKAMK